MMGMTIVTQLTRNGISYIKDENNNISAPKKMKTIKKAIYHNKIIKKQYEKISENHR